MICSDKYRSKAKLSCVSVGLNAHKAKAEFDVVIEIQRKKRDRIEFERINEIEE